MGKLRFVEDEYGVHVMGVEPAESEATICGIWDSHRNDLQSTRKRVVTCQGCIRVLKAFRDVKYEEKC